VICELPVVAALLYNAPSAPQRLLASLREVASLSCYPAATDAITSSNVLTPLFSFDSSQVHRVK